MGVAFECTPRVGGDWGYMYDSSGSLACQLSVMPAASRWHPPPPCCVKMEEQGGYY